MAREWLWPTLLGQFVVYGAQLRDAGRGRGGGQGRFGGFQVEGGGRGAIGGDLFSHGGAKFAALACRTIALLWDVILLAFAERLSLNNCHWLQAGGRPVRFPGGAACLQALPRPREV